jgi:hypothetical protein
VSWTVWILESTVCTHGKVLVLDGDRRQGLTCTVESHMIVRSYRRTAIYLRKCRPTALPFYLSFFSLLDHVIKKCQEGLILSSWNWQVQKMHGRSIGSFIPKKNSRLQIHFEALLEDENPRHPTTILGFMSISSFSLFLSQLTFKDSSLLISIWDCLLNILFVIRQQRKNIVEILIANKALPSRIKCEILSFVKKTIIK